MNKLNARKRRAARTRHVLNNSTDRHRLVVFRSGKHVYAQIFDNSEQGNKVLVSCSTIDKELRGSITGPKQDQAKQVGELLGQRAKKLNITKIAFDRSGYAYHGRVKALAEGARAAGLEF